MKKVITIALILSFLAGVGVLLLSNERGAPPPDDDATDLAVTPASEKSDASTPHPGSEPAAMSTARQRVADAELALEMAIAQRKAAEADIAVAEREVEELEQWVAEIEARGEDPIDYADEGLEKLQPAFFAYQDAVQRFELAEAMEITATEELAVANAALSAMLASGTEN